MLIRCDVTKNPVGTDTEMIGRPCQCQACAAARRIAELEAALSNIVDHHLAMAGPRAHSLGCECGGTNDGKHSCASLQSAIVVATGLLF